MEYKLVKASIEKDWSHATLWFANPNCVFETPHKVFLFDNYHIELLMSKVSGCAHVDLNDLPIEFIPEEFHTIHANYVEVEIGLHKHVNRKINGRPVLTTHVHVFAPLVKVDGPCERWTYLRCPRQLAQEQINRYWIPVDED